jgi:hypothetical protein
MTINGIEVLSVEHLEELAIDMDEQSKVGARILFALESKSEI